MHIILTDKAIEAFNKKLEQRNTPNAYIRVGVKGSSACAGFGYHIQYEDNQPREKDLLLFFNGIRVLIDSKSIVYLDGCIIDWERSLTGEGFRVINNREVARCGCGKSVSF